MIEDERLKRVHRISNRLDDSSVASDERLGPIDERFEDIDKAPALT